MKQLFFACAAFAVLILTAPSANALTASVKQVKVVHNVTLDGATGVRIILYDFSISGHKDRQFYFGMNVAQDDRWLELWTASDHYDNMYDPGVIEGEVYWFFFPYDLLKQKGVESKPFDFFVFVVNSEDSNDFHRQSVTVRLSDAKTTAKKDVPVKKQKKKNSARLKRIRDYILRLETLGPIGTLLGTPPSDPVPLELYTTAKTTMEKQEVAILSGVKKQIDKAQKKVIAELEKSSKADAAGAETQVKNEAEIQKTQGASRAEGQLKSEATPKSDQGANEIVSRAKNGETAVEEAVEASEDKVEAAQQGGRSDAEIKSLCGGCQKAIEFADKKARELIQQNADAAKEAVKKQLEAAADKLKEETVGRIEAKAEELKDAIQQKVNATSEELGTKVKAESTAAVKTQVNTAVQSLSPELKPYAEQFLPQVEEKITVTLEKQVDEIMDKASRKITKTANGKINAVMEKITGPVHEAIDQKTEEAIQFANARIDAAADAALKKLDEKKAQALARLEKSCSAPSKPASKPAATDGGGFAKPVWRWVRENDPNSARVYFLWTPIPNPPNTPAGYEVAVSLYYSYDPSARVEHWSDARKHGKGMDGATGLNDSADGSRTCYWMLRVVYPHSSGDVVVWSDMLATPPLP